VHVASKSDLMKLHANVGDQQEFSNYANVGDQQEFSNYANEGKWH
jgi:hypothetical protein